MLTSTIAQSVDESVRERECRNVTIT